jgi:succinoglycan biosynthesis transport protein ExoP
VNSPGSRDSGAHLEEGSGGSLPPFVLDPIGVARRRWRWMLVAGLVGVLGTSAAVWLWKPVYWAESTILITSQQIPSDFVRSTVREDTVSNINAMVGEVLSQRKLSGVVERLDPYSKQREEGGMEAAIARLRSDTVIGPSLRQDRRRGDSALLYSISFTHADPEMAAAVANEMAALFIEASLARRQRQARRATEFLKRELERDNSELREQSRRVSEFRQANRGRLPEELKGNLQKIELLANERNSLTTRIAEIQNRITELSSAPDRPNELSEPEQVLQGLRQQLVQQLAAHTEDHPNVAALRRRIEAQEKLVAEEPAKETSTRSVMIAAQQGEKRILEQRLAAINKEYDDLNERVDQTPAIANDLAALEQDLSVLRADYLDTARKVEEAELAESLESAQQGGQVVLLDKARVPNAPTRPRWQVGVMGLAGTIALSLGIAVLLELVDPVMVGVAQLEAVTDWPLIGSLPHVS